MTDIASEVLKRAVSGHYKIRFLDTGRDHEESIYAFMQSTNAKVDIAGISDGWWYIDAPPALLLNSAIIRAICRPENVHTMWHISDAFKADTARKLAIISIANYAPFDLTSDEVRFMADSYNGQKYKHLYSRIYMTYEVAKWVIHNHRSLKDAIIGNTNLDRATAIEISKGDPDDLHVAFGGNFYEADKDRLESVPKNISIAAAIKLNGWGAKDKSKLEEWANLYSCSSIADFAPHSLAITRKSWENVYNLQLGIWQKIPNNIRIDYWNSVLAGDHKWLHEARKKYWPGSDNVHKRISLELSLLADKPLSDRTDEELSIMAARCV